LQDAARLQSQQQWVTDPNFRSTTLLLQADNAANSAQNNTFLDSSSNSFAITRNGNTTQGTFTPFSQAPGYWGNFFFGQVGVANGSISATHPAMNATWTIETWIYRTSGGVNQCITLLNNGGFSGILVYISSSNYLTVNDGVTAVGSFTTVSVPINAWTHIAVVRSGGTTTGYVNGVVAGSNTFTPQTVSSIRIGEYFAGDFMFFPGYMSNFRVVNGAAVYAGAFTPPTAPLTNITNTSLLTCQSNRFVDNSTANSGSGWPITVNGNASVQPFAPFAPQFQYTQSVIGGSGYFDGTGDFLSVPDNVAFTMGAGDFTIEAWVYVTATSGSQAIFGTSNAAGNQGSMSFVLLAQNSSGFPTIGVGYLGVVYTAVSSEALVKNQWNHIAGVRNGAIVSIYVNGVSRGTLNMGTLTITDSTEIVGIGRNGDFNGEYLTGYISSARIVKGTAVYTANFTPPTAPLTAITNTQLLTNFTNAGIIDGTMDNVVETVGNAQVSTNAVKYGSGSMFFDGTGDYLIPNAATTDLYAFGTGDFTIEMWVYPVSSSTSSLYDSRPSGTNGAYLQIAIVSGQLLLGLNNTAILQAGTISTNTWTHIAVSRLGTSLRGFINGTQVGSTLTNSTSLLNVAQRPVIGTNGNTVTIENFNGYMDDLRVTKGVARYISNFTPPQVALPRQ
jgi:hypothetical protein